MYESLDQHNNLDTSVQQAFVFHSFTYHTMDLTLLPPSSLLNAASGVSELVGHLPMPSTRLTRANAVVDRQELLKEAHESDEVTKRIMVLQIPTIE